jgi:hypothetical protein
MDERIKRDSTPRKPAGAAAVLPWVERAACAYLCHGPRAIGFSELGPDERRAVLALATELVVPRPPRRPSGTVAGGMTGESRR